MTVKNWSLHQPWCAAVIAENAMLPWRVRCDCKPKKPKEPKPMPHAPAQCECLMCLAEETSIPGHAGEKKDAENG